MGSSVRWRCTARGSFQNKRAPRALMTLTLLGCGEGPHTYSRSRGGEHSVCTERAVRAPGFQVILQPSLPPLKLHKQEPGPQHLVGGLNPLPHVKYKPHLAPSICWLNVSHDDYHNNQVQITTFLSTSSNFQFTTFSRLPTCVRTVHTRTQEGILKSPQGCIMVRFVLTAHNMNYFYPHTWPQHQFLARENENSVLEIPAGSGISGECFPLAAWLTLAAQPRGEESPVTCPDVSLPLLPGLTCSSQEKGIF